MNLSLKCAPLSVTFALIDLANLAAIAVYLTALGLNAIKDTGLDIPATLLFLAFHSSYLLLTKSRSSQGRIVQGQIPFQSGVNWLVGGLGILAIMYSEASGHFLDSVGCHSLTESIALLVCSLKEIGGFLSCTTILTLCSIWVAYLGREIISLLKELVEVYTTIDRMLHWVRRMNRSEDTMVLTDDE